MRFAAQENAIPGQIEVGAGAAPGADAIRADARRFRRLVASDTAQARTAAVSGDASAGGASRSLPARLRFGQGDGAGRGGEAGAHQYD